MQPSLHILRQFQNGEAAWEYPVAMASPESALNSVPFFWTTFFVYLKWSLEGLYALPKTLLITLILSGNLAASLILKWPFRHDRWKKDYWLVLANFLSIPATLASAVLWRVEPDPAHRGNPHMSAVWTVNGISIAAVVLGTYFVYRMKNVRWFAASITLLALWMLFWAGFIAGMALSGDWL